MIARQFGLAAAASAALLLGGTAARAGVIASASVSGAAPGMTLENFNSVPLGSANVTLPSGLTVVFKPDAGAMVGAVDTIAAAPFLSGGDGVGFGAGGATQPDGVDATTYLTTGSVAANSAASVTLLLPAAEPYFGLLWGSIDPYNTLSFYSGSTLVGSFTGTDVFAGANGDQSAMGTLYVDFMGNAGTTFDRVVATSAGYAFEFDNVAFGGAAVPEPMSAVLLASGLAGAALVRRARS